MVLVFIGLVAWFGSFLYQKRSVVYPALDYYQATRIPDESKMAGAVTGEVAQVIDGRSFQLKTAGGTDFVIGLTGLELPEKEIAVQKGEDGKGPEAVELLSRLILARQVRVELTFISERRSGLGVVFFGDTNINAALVEAGVAKVNRQYLKSLPVKERYALLRAARKAEMRKQ